MSYGAGGDPLGPQHPYGNPYASSPLGTSYSPVSQQLSIMALSSFLVALLSPLGFCFCFPTIVGSVIAIVLGHVAWIRIGQSNGVLWGKGWAIAGLAIAYPLLIISLLMMPSWLKGFQEGFEKGFKNAQQPNAIGAP